MRFFTAFLSLTCLFTTISARYDLSISNERRAALEVPQRPGFTLTWSETFSKPGAISSSEWQFDVGTSYPEGPPNWGTGEIQTYTNSLKNAYISQNEHLTIVPLQNPKTGTWTSARIETVEDSFKCQPGGQMIIEAKILLPGGGMQEGVWAAFWAMGRKFRRNGNDGWPMTGEWDIMEAVNGGNTTLGTVHCGSFPGGPCDEPNGIGGTANIVRGVFNNYALRIDRTSQNWRKEYLSWSVNDVEYHTVSGYDIGNYTTWSNLVHEPFFLLFNVAMGGGFPNAWAGHVTPTPKTTPGYGMLVDWVAVYNK
ncbi:Carbohydrate binding 6 [Orbilia blumenaviensis]|uniref:Carbohydrate binding 6 n=1 Tax=Orbilia blumenaviensis TaxID=1796055 RepID=A0AAV9VAC1_9PEZI